MKVLVRGLLCLAALLAVTAGCGDDDGSADATADATAEGNRNSTTTVGAAAGTPSLADLEDGGLELLQQTIGEALAPLQLVVTRGSVEHFATGPHLALYAEPTSPVEENDPSVYAERMLSAFLAIRPLLFDAHPELASFDLCQEPVPGTEGSGTEVTDADGDGDAPETVLLMTRAGYESVSDWESATLTDLFRAARRHDGQVVASDAVAATPVYAAADAASS